MKRPVWPWIIVTFLLLAASAMLASNFNGDRVVRLTPEEKAWLKAHPEIRFAPDPDFPPMEYFDGNGGYNGITADYVGLMEKSLGIRFKIVRLRNWDEIIAGARDGRIDMYIATKTPQRANHMLFTRPLLEFPTVIIARKKTRVPLEVEKLMGKKVSVVSEYAAHNFIAHNYPQLKLDVVPDIRTGLRKVSFGTSDALVENLATASYYIEKEGITNLRIAGETGYVYRMGFASRSDWPLLNQILEKGMAGIGEDQKKAIYRKWIPLEPASLFNSKGFRRAIYSAFAAVALLIAGIIAWNRVLTGQVRLRTGELENELTERRRMEGELRQARDELEKRVAERTAELAIAEASLRENEARLKIAMDMAQLVQWEYDCGTGMFTFDEQFYALYGTTSGREGGPLMSAEAYAKRFIPADEHAVVSAGIAQVLKNSANQLEHRIIRADGEERFIVVRGEVVRDEAGRTVRIQGANQDITERKRVQERLKQKKQQLELLNGTLEKRIREEVEKNQEKDVILIQQNRQAALGEAMEHITHQWKQPISTMYLLNYYLEQISSSGDLTGEQVRESVKTSNQLLEHMTQTIDVFRDFYRPEKQQVEFSIKESIETTLPFIATALRFHSITVECDLDADLRAIGYPREFSQVLLNILGNARDVCRERKTDNPKVTVKAFCEGDRAVVTITDNAGGIPETKIDNIFDLYFTTKEASGGTGIGLYLSRTIIEKNMCGRLSAANVADGAQFRIELRAP